MTAKVYVPVVCVGVLGLVAWKPEAVLGLLSGAVALPFALWSLGFGLLGPTAGSVAAWGVGGAGGGAFLGFGPLQSLGMRPHVSAAVGAVIGVLIYYRFFA
jgi:hypothetical protein